MKPAQKGFVLIEGILICAIIAIVAGTGYYVWHSKSQTDKTLSSTLSESSTAKSTFLKTSQITDYPNMGSWSTFADTKNNLNYSVKLPKDVSAITTDFGDGTRLGFYLATAKNQNLSFLEIGAIFDPPTYTGQGSEDETYAWNLFQIDGLKAVASASRGISIKGNQVNKNINDKFIGPLTKIDITKGEAWGYEADEAYGYGFKSDISSGAITNGFPEWVIFLSDGNNIYRGTAAYGNETVSNMLNSLSI